MNEDNFELGNNYGNSLSFDEIGSILRALDIDIDDKALEGAERNWNSMPKECLENMDKVALTLSYIGKGSYNYDSGILTPSSDKIFNFDPELYDPDSMFEFFVAGIMSINGGDFEISNIRKETVSDDDIESGIYKRNIKFKFNGSQYSYEASVYYDWFDFGIIDCINDILEKERLQKRIYSVCGADMSEIFYRTPEWAKEFTAKTGSRLSR